MEEVLIRIPKEKYQFLIKTIDSHQGLLKKLGVNPLVKQSLVRDIQIVKSILNVNKYSMH